LTCGTIAALCLPSFRLELRFWMATNLKGAQGAGVMRHEGDSALPPLRPLCFVLPHSASLLSLPHSVRACTCVHVRACASPVLSLPAQGAFQRGGGGAQVPAGRGGARRGAAGRGDGAAGRGDGAAGRGGGAAVAHLEKEMFFSVSDWPNISRTRLSTTSCNSAAGAGARTARGVGRQGGGRREAGGERREAEGTWWVVAGWGAKGTGREASTRRTLPNRA
jgi:hypothetical protein